MSADSSSPVLVNGVAEDRVSSLDRGLLYGDGLFETLAVINGAPVFWSRHMARLQSGCDRLGMPRVDADRLAEEVRVVLQDTDRCVLKLIVTRGPGGRGYRVPADPRPTRIVQRHPWPDHPADCQERGVRIRLCEQRLAANPRLAGIKHLNRLEQVLARREWDDADIREGIMADHHGNLIEGTMSNLFIVQDRQLVTPELGRCGVAGVMRSVVMAQAEELGLSVAVRNLTLTALQAANEVFLTNSLIGIWPVIRFDEHAWSRGPVTRELQERLMRPGGGEDA